MYQALRPYVTAGVALAGASLIAVTPVTATLPDIQVRDVALTSGGVPDLAGIDPITPWLDVFNTAAANAETVFHALFEADSDLLHAIAANPTAPFTHAQELFDATTFLGGDQLLNNVVANSTLDISHALVYLGLTGQASFAFPPPAEPIPTIVNFLSSPLSGVLIGEVGPLISPEVAFLNSIEAVFHALTGPNADPLTALEDLINTPANVVNGFFNGAILNLNPLIPLIEQANLIPLPPGTTLNDLSFAFGGLFSPGDVTTGVSGVSDGVGGSILNSLGLNLSGVPIFGTLDAEAVPVGPIGAWAGLKDILAGVLTGSIVPPPDDGSGAAVDIGDVFSNLLGGDPFGLLGL